MTTHSAQMATSELAASADQLQSSLQGMGSLGDQFASKLVTAFDQVAAKGKTLEATVKSLAQSFSDLALKAALKPLTSGIGSVFDQAIGGLSSILGGGGGGATGAPVMPFADGGIISSPVRFPLGNGQAAIAGEQGAEAILPLTRGTDGQLGVRGGGGASSGNVTFNISTPDVAGFQRSSTQIAAMMQRSITMGQRNL
jgi:phage-related minor tail protein